MKYLPAYLAYISYKSNYLILGLNLFCKFCRFCDINQLFFKDLTGFIRAMRLLHSTTTTVTISKTATAPAMK